MTGDVIVDTSSRRNREPYQTVKAAPSHKLRFAFVLAALALSGCIGPQYANRKLDAYGPALGYRFDSIGTDEGDPDSLFICLTFSGGGTRAAAFAYGVLLGLRETQIPGDGRMIDEVDLISAVSGGSFTAMAYALWGDDLFNGRFKNRFLTHNIQLDIALSFLTPKYFLRAPFVALDSIDVASFYYDEEIFDGKTYGDLLSRNRRPFVVVNATDVSRRQRFEFTQDDFDLLGSDLASVPVGAAVAASSAFPILLSPLRLKYFHGPPLQRAVAHTLSAEAGIGHARRRRWARSLLDGMQAETPEEVVIDESAHKYLYLLDGGLADNLGLRYFIESYRSGAIWRRMERGQIDRLVVIVVDANTDPSRGLESRTSSPSLFDVGRAVGLTAMQNHGEALTESVRYALLEVQPATRQAYEECNAALRENCPDADPPPVPLASRTEPYVIDLNFRQIKDEKKRKGLLSTVTNLFLPRRDVEKLIEAGRQLVKDHPEFQRLLRDLDAANRGG